MFASFSESSSDSDEVRSTKSNFPSQLSVIRCFLCSGEHKRSPITLSGAEEVMRAAFECGGFSSVGRVNCLQLSCANCSLDPNAGTSARSLKGISLTTTMSSSSPLLSVGLEDPKCESSSVEVEISDAGDAERDERSGDESAELLCLAQLPLPCLDLPVSLFLEKGSLMGKVR